MTKEELAEEIKEQLRNEEGDFEEVTKDGDMLIRTQMESGYFDGYSVLFYIHDEDAQVAFHPPVRIRRESIPSVSEFLMRVNYELRLGKVVLDYDQGKVHFEFAKEIATFAEDADQAFYDLLHVPNLAMDAIMPECLAVMGGTKTPEQAVKDYRAAIDKISTLNPSEGESAAGEVKLKVEDYVENKSQWKSALAVALGVCLFATPLFACPRHHSACHKYAVRHGYSHVYGHAYRHYPSHRYHAGSYCVYDPYSYYGVTFATPAVVVEEPVVVPQPVVVRPAVRCCSATDAYQHHGLVGGTLRLVFGICFGDNHEPVVAPAPVQVASTSGEVESSPFQEKAQKAIDERKQ